MLSSIRYRLNLCLITTTTFICELLLIVKILSLGCQLFNLRDILSRWTLPDSRTDVRQIINTLPKEDSQSPVVHHVRVTATSMLMILHVICRWPLNFHPSAAEFVFSLTSIMEVTLNDNRHLMIAITDAKGNYEIQTN